MKIVNDGAAALAEIDAKPPGVILLDWILPGLSGVAICRGLKSARATRLIPGAAGSTATSRTSSSA